MVKFCGINSPKKGFHPVPSHPSCFLSSPLLPLTPSPKGSPHWVSRSHEYAWCDRISPYLAWLDNLSSHVPEKGRSGDTVNDIHSCLRACVVGDSVTWVSYTKTTLKGKAYSFGKKEFKPNFTSKFSISHAMCVIWSIHPYSITTVAKKDIIALLNGLQP